MTDQALSQREFDSWKELDGEFKQRMRTHIQQQANSNIRLHERLATVEAKQDEYAGASNRKVTWISSIISALVGGIVGAVTGGAR